MKNRDANIEFGKRVKARRIELGMSQEELALKAGYNGRSSISLVELGKRDIPASKVQALAKALEIEPTELIFGKKYFDKDRLLDIYIGLNDKSREHLLNYAQFLQDGDNHEDG